MILIYLINMKIYFEGFGSQFKKKNVNIRTCNENNSIIPFTGFVWMVKG